MNRSHVAPTACSNAYWRGVAAISAVALCWRSLWLLRPDWEIGDASEYLKLGQSIVHAGIFSYDGSHPSSYRPPLYPAFIAAAHLFTGHPVEAVLIVQVIIGTLTVTLACLIATHYFDQPTAIVAGAMLAIAPMTSRYTALLLTETLFTFLIIASLSLWSRNHRLMSGVLLGLATLTRASTLPFVFIISLIGLARVNRRSHRELLVAFLGALLVLAPWVARNVGNVGRWTIADAGFGVNLLYGTADLRSGSNRWTQLSALSELVGTRDGEPTVYEENRARHMALTRIRAHPLSWFRARIRQWPWLFIDSGDYLPIEANRVAFRQALAVGNGLTVLIKVGFLIGNVVVCTLAVVGLWLSRHRFVELSPLWSFPAFLAVVHLPMYVEPRYGLPLLPFTLIFAAAAITHVRSRPPAIAHSVGLGSR
jgi:4-amino-4-deoxy-L-arabinose transferase-like glycosyltransferase